MGRLASSFLCALLSLAEASRGKNNRRRQKKTKQKKPHQIRTSERCWEWTEVRCGRDVMSYVVALHCPEAKGLKKKLWLLGVIRKYSTTMINITANSCDRLDLLQRGWRSLCNLCKALPKKENNKKIWYGCYASGIWLSSQDDCL